MGCTSVVNMGCTSVVNMGCTSVVNMGCTSVVNMGCTSVVNMGCMSVVNMGHSSHVFFRDGGRKRPWSNLQHYFFILLEGLNKTSKNINHVSRYLARDLKPKPTGLRRARFIFKTRFQKKSDEIQKKDQ